MEFGRRLDGDNPVRGERAALLVAAEADHGRYVHQSHLRRLERRPSHPHVPTIEAPGRDWERRGAGRPPHLVGHRGVHEPCAQVPGAKGSEPAPSEAHLQGRHAAQHRTRGGAASGAGRDARAGTGAAGQCGQSRHTMEVPWQRACLRRWGSGISLRLSLLWREDEHAAGQWHLSRQRAQGHAARRWRGENHARARALLHL